MKAGWVKVRLEDLTEQDSPITYGVVKPGEEGSVRFVRGGDISDGQILFDKLRTITTEISEQYSRTLLRGGELLICLVGQPGQVAIASNNLAGANIARQVGLIRLRPEFNSKFIKYFLQSPDGQRSLGAHMGGSVQQVINLGDLRTIEIPLPSPMEQHRIVTVLDEALDGIASAKANAEKNLQNARILFESHLQSVFTQRGEGWVEIKLADVCGFQNGFAFKSNTFKPTGVPIIRISNIQDGRIDINNRLVFFDPKDYRENLDRYRIIADDLLIAMSGATTGKIGFNTENTVFYLNQRVGKFEPSEKLNKRFLYHYLSTKVEENLQISAGAAQPNLSTEQIKEFALPLPPIDEQERIVNALENLQEKTQRLESLYQQKIAALDALKKSLLHQAFSGQL